MIYRVAYIDFGNHYNTRVFTELLLIDFVTASLSDREWNIIVNVEEVI